MKYRVFVVSFGDEIARGVVPTLLAQPWIEHIHWIVEAMGRTMPGEGDPRLTLIDQYDALYPPQTPDTAAARQLADRVRPIVLPMMDRLEKHGPDIAPTKRERILRNNANYWIDYIDEHHINGYIGANVPHEITDYIIAEYLATQSYARVRYFIPWRTDMLLPVSDFRDLGSDRVGRMSTPNEAERAHLEVKAENIVRVFRNSEAAATTPFYMRKKSVDWTRRTDRHRTRRRLWAKLKRLRTLNGLKRGLRHLLYLLNRRYRLPRKDEAIRRAYAHLASSELDLSVPYIYFAMHLQPEASTSPLGKQYVDHRLAVRHLLECLPENVYVYIKENPKQGYLGRRENYYAGFPQSGRVKYAPLNFPSQRLIEHSLAVATITGTVGFEALWVPKPVLVFGHTFYGHGPGVFWAGDRQSLASAINTILSGNWRSQMTPEEYIGILAHRSVGCNVTDYFHRHAIYPISVERTAERIVNELTATFTKLDK